MAVSPSMDEPLACRVSCPTEGMTPVWRPRVGACLSLCRVVLLTLACALVVSACESSGDSAEGEEKINSYSDLSLATHEYDVEQSLLVSMSFPPGILPEDDSRVFSRPPIELSAVAEIGYAADADNFRQTLKYKEISFMGETLPTTDKKPEVTIFSSQGEILSLQGVTDSVALSENPLRAGFLCPVLPAGGVEAGDRWEVPREVSASGPAVNVMHHVEKVERDGEKVLLFTARYKAAWEAPIDMDALAASLDTEFFSPVTFRSAVTVRVEETCEINTADKSVRFMGAEMHMEEDWKAQKNNEDLPLDLLPYDGAHQEREQHLKIERR